MKHVISATEARVHFGRIMRQVVEHQDTVVVERAGEPKVVVLSVAEYERLHGNQHESDDWWNRAMRSRERMKRELGGRPLPPIDEIIHEMREERDAQIINNLCRR